MSSDPGNEQTMTSKLRECGKICKNDRGLKIHQLLMKCQYQRAVRIHNIRQETKALKSQYKEAGEKDRNGLAQLMCILRKKIRVLRRAEWHRRQHRKRARKHAAFIANPFKFTKELLGQKRRLSSTLYKVYKNYPKLLLRLWKILRVFWRRGKIPEQRKVAEGVWIRKEENSTQIDQFRIISLLCVEQVRPIQAHLPPGVTVSSNILQVLGSDFALP
ncbi:hypothetical protein SKAU_G00416160 [Synaphobranchus kaupii]|uniref:Uncharacterized protein n=1 Tax=Synaphobranchus kaupii TaxID=118154 RepID=A0A9Q1E7F5_SYNKA|nr:hypothetical protein SKAU_G00416160 [Synaphobranchus kaupii]